MFCARHTLKSCNFGSCSSVLAAIGAPRPQVLNLRVAKANDVKQVTCFPAGMEGFDLCLSSLNPSEDCSAQVCIWQPEFHSMFECIACGKKRVWVKFP